VTAFNDSKQTLALNRHATTGNLIQLSRKPNAPHLVNCLAVPDEFVKIPRPCPSNRCLLVSVLPLELSDNGINLDSMLLSHFQGIGYLWHCLPRLPSLSHEFPCDMHQALGIRENIDGRCVRLRGGCEE
jgi:hypothetical protein